MNEKDFKERTKVFPLRLLKLIDSLPETGSGRIPANQLGRSGTWAGADDRAACRSRSEAEMISKLSVVEEETDESCFWRKLMVDQGLMPADKLSPLLREADKLTAIMVASRRTLAAKSPKSRTQNRK